MGEFSIFVCEPQLKIFLTLLGFKKCHISFPREVSYLSIATC